MTNARLTIDEAQAFLAGNPGVQWVDAFVFDMNGIPRGKRIRRSNLLGVAKGGLMMPSSVFVMDPHGNCVEETGRLWHPARSPLVLESRVRLICLKINR
jgi:glutamine synthetase